MYWKHLKFWEITVQCSSMVFYGLVRAFKNCFYEEKINFKGWYESLLVAKMTYYLWFLTLNILVIFCMGARSFIYRSDTLATNICDYKNHAIFYNNMCLNF